MVRSVRCDKNMSGVRVARLVKKFEILKERHSRGYAPPHVVEEENVQVAEAAVGHPNWVGISHDNDTFSGINSATDLSLDSNDTSNNMRMASSAKAKVENILRHFNDNEAEYLASLKIITMVYKDFILTHVRKQEVHDIFRKVDDIIGLHQMFKIELEEKLEKFNSEERIGSIFGYFSEPWRLHIYSDYVNNFKVATEKIEEVIRTRRSVRDFIEKRQREDPDKLTLFTLMLKPVQRIPQYITIIQDLLKYTPLHHHDRCRLQESATSLESVAYKINRRRRKSEQVYYCQQITKQLPTRVQPHRCAFLIRQDNMEEQITENTTGNTSIKQQRRIILMSDRLVSVAVTERGQHSVMNGSEFTYKWHHKLCDLDLISIIQNTLYERVASFDTGFSELRDIEHDEQILSQMIQLMASLKMTDPMLTDAKRSLQSFCDNLSQKKIIILKLKDLQITLEDTNREKTYVLRTDIAKVRQEWCTDFLLAKYADDIENKSSWHRQETEDIEEAILPPIFIKHMPLDISNKIITMSCGIEVYFRMRDEESFGHVLVCSSAEDWGQISIVSCHLNKPTLTKSFQATESRIVCVEYVPVCDRLVDVEDAVWISTADHRIQVLKLENDPDLYRQCIDTFEIDCIVTCMRYMKHRVFCGTNTGNVIIFKRKDGEWNEEKTITLEINHSVASMIIVDDYLWIACGSKVYILDTDNCALQNVMESQCDTESDDQHEFQFLVKIGIGVWSSFLGKSNLCLYNIETRRLLQDLNITQALDDFINEHRQYPKQVKYEVTSLMASQGFLWIGTDVGIILSYLLPISEKCVPRISDSPHLSLHSHIGPVKFFIQVNYGGIVAPFGPQTQQGTEKTQLEIASGSTTPETMRKQDSRTIMVLSGGDGYYNDSEERLENEPVLMFWIYSI